MKYKWNSRKRGRKQHLCSDEGLTYCKAENGSRSLDTLSEAAHPERQVCAICRRMNDTGQTPPGIPKDTGRGTREEKKRRYRDLFLATWEWRRVRYGVLRDSGGRCARCGLGRHDGAVLDVDHIVPRRRRPDLALTPSNLQVLCSSCNVGKGSFDETDWRGKETAPSGVLAAYESPVPSHEDAEPAG